MNTIKTVKLSTGATATHVLQNGIIRVNVTVK